MSARVVSGDSPRTRLTETWPRSPMCSAARHPDAPTCLCGSCLGTVPGHRWRRPGRARRCARPFGIPTRRHVGAGRVRGQSPDAADGDVAALADSLGERSERRCGGIAPL